MLQRIPIWLPWMFLPEQWQKMMWIQQCNQLLKCSPSPFRCILQTCDTIPVKIEWVNNCFITFIRIQFHLSGIFNYIPSHVRLVLECSFHPLDQERFVKKVFEWIENWKRKKERKRRIEEKDMLKVYSDSDHYKKKVTFNITMIIVTWK